MRFRTIRLKKLFGYLFRVSATEPGVLTFLPLGNQINNMYMHVFWGGNSIKRHILHRRLERKTTIEFASQQFSYSVKDLRR